MTPEPKMPSKRLRASLAVLCAGIACLVPASDAIGAPEPGTYAWPVEGPVLRPFEEPPSPYEAGHRGIDIGAAFGTPFVAAESGVVAFAGWIAGSLFVSVDHPDGVRTTYSWLSEALVSPGQEVTKGEVLGHTGQGHPGSIESHLHFGARVGTEYIDPMYLLAGTSVAGIIHLAPLEDSDPPPTAPVPEASRRVGTTGSAILVR